MELPPTLISCIKTQSVSLWYSRSLPHTKCSFQSEADDASFSGTAEIKSALRLARLHREGNAFIANMYGIQNSCQVTVGRGGKNRL